MDRRGKSELKRQMFEYKVTGRLPRKFKREVDERWYMSDTELRHALKLDDVEQETHNG